MSLRIVTLQKVDEDNKDDEKVDDDDNDDDDDDDDDDDNDNDSQMNSVIRNVCQCFPLFVLHFHTSK